MDIRKALRGLCLITDTSRSAGRTHEEITAAGIAGGASVIQMREKALSAREAYPIAVRLREMTLKAGVLFIVNDSVELAMAAHADGVHLGQEDFPVEDARRLLGYDKIIGLSTHSPDEALAAVEAGADYIGFGPMFITATKDAGKPQGPGALKALRGVVKIPIVAIGGIDADNAGEVIAAGADAVAVITAVTAAKDMEAAARGIAGLFKGGI